MTHPLFTLHTQAHTHTNTHTHTSRARELICAAEIITHHDKSESDLTFKPEEQEESRDEDRVYPKAAHFARFRTTQICPVPVRARACVRVRVLSFGSVR